MPDKDWSCLERFVYSYSFNNLVTIFIIIVLFSLFTTSDQVSIDDLPEKMHLLIHGFVVNRSPVNWALYCGPEN